MKALFLYTELSSYFLACSEKLVRQEKAEVHVVHWPVNPEAPFQFKSSDGIRFYEKKSMTEAALHEWVDALAPDVIYCSGWMDPVYLRVAHKHKGRIPVIVGMDNRWKGSLRQRIGVMLRRPRLQSCFTHAWIPGPPQREFARRLGFSGTRLLEGVYSCDHDQFHAVYVRSKITREKNYPHVFLYVGRYHDFKGVRDLWNAFVRFKKISNSDWKLWCMGTGSVPPMQHPDIRHFGFVQPEQMKEIIPKAGVFVIPSRFEPWSVALHEMTSAGLPVISSTAVGAASVFLRDGLNGLSFSAGDERALFNALSHMAGLADDRLFLMGEESSKLAAAITPSSWARTLADLCRNKR